MRKPESRTLIFVATRACAQRLSEHLNDYLPTCENLRAFQKKQNNVGFMTSIFFYFVFLLFLKRKAKPMEEARKLY